MAGKKGISGIVEAEKEEGIVLYYRKMTKHGKRQLMGILETLKDE